MSFLSFAWITINAISAQAEPASLFKPIVDDIQRQLPNGLKMRLPAYLPPEALALHPFVQANAKGLQVYLSPEANCKQPKCSVGGIAVFTQEGFSPWSRQLKKGTPVSLPNGIQGYYLALGKKDTDHYVLWQQDGFGFVLGTDRHSISQQELIQIAASTVVEPPLGGLDQGADVLILSQPNATGATPVTRPFP
ncbi:hypothetical protein H6F76_03130 [Leptolyngbya sp. FACHB-321]|uniref:hypothetical protein n=1 Tax=Leptolyngbya sp. FACHB-321 TaxID=2692807 RepID=UPI0016886B4E|nr:hypothetical protein [Leptolyngbya sp. FACHB-321]MBD2034044.1 hypothetical protein [Leptolyngbya sp. FACHB-321]